MRVTVLMENSTPSSRLVARHGLSLWIELDGGRCDDRDGTQGDDRTNAPFGARCVLFDMGPDEAFLANARTLGVDVTTAEVNLNNEVLSLIRAKNAVKTQTSNLANVMGVTRNKPFVLDDTIEAEPFTLTFEEALAQAYANRPDVRSSRTALQISEIALNQAKAAYWPTFTLGASFSKSGDEFRLDNDQTRLYAGVEIPIFSALRVYNGVKQARINLSSAQNSDRSLANDVFMEVQNAFIALNEAAESIPVAESTVERAKESGAVSVEEIIGAALKGM